MVANRRAGGGSMMGAAAFNDPSSLSLSLSLARDARRVCICGGARASGRLFLCERCWLVSSGSTGAPRAAAAHAGRASHIHTGSRAAPAGGCRRERTRYFCCWFGALPRLCWFWIGSLAALCLVAVCVASRNGRGEPERRRATCSARGRPGRARTSSRD